MGKFIAIIILIIVLVGIYFVYDKNVNDVGVQIEKLKLKYTINETSPPEQVLLFASELDKLSFKVKDQDKARLTFEAYFWNALALSKDVAGILGGTQIGVLECGIDDVKLKEKIAEGKESLNSAKKDFELVQAQYTNIEQKDFSAKLDNIESSLEISENLIFALCPK